MTLVIKKYLKLGSTSIGIRTKEGVLLAAEKRVSSKLMVKDTIEKISKEDDHVGESPFSTLLQPWPATVLIE